MNNYTNITILIIFTLLIRCTDNVSGSAQQGEAKVIGIIKDETGKPIGNTNVYLLPSDFNPIIDSINWSRVIAYNTTTNDSGAYEFPNVTNGDYVLNGNDSLSLKHIYMPGIHIESEDLNLGINIINNNSYITVSLNDTLMSKNGYLYIKGTEFYQKLDTSNVITIAVPSDTIDINFLSVTDSIDKSLYVDVVTSEVDTLDISGTPNAPVISGNDSLIINSLSNFSITNYSDTLAYRFCWGDNDTSKWFLDSVFSHSWDTTGNYSIKAQARTLLGTILYSKWSAELLVTVLPDDSLSDTLNDTVPAPATPTGNDTVTQLSNEIYSTNIWGFNNDLYEFRFNWGDSINSSWSQDTFASHSWSIDSTPASFPVKSQARLKADSTKVSTWSGILDVFVTF